MQTNLFHFSPGPQPLHGLRDGPSDDGVPGAVRDGARVEEDERPAQDAQLCLC